MRVKHPTKMDGKNQRKYERENQTNGRITDQWKKIRKDH